MIKAKLYCIVYSQDNSEEPYSFHTVGVDMDFLTARLLSQKHFENEYGTESDIEDISPLEYYKVTVDGYKIDIEEEIKQ